MGEVWLSGKKKKKNERGVHMLFAELIYKIGPGLALWEERKEETKKSERGVYMLFAESIYRNRASLASCREENKKIKKKRTRYTYAISEDEKVCKTVKETR